MHKMRGVKEALIISYNGCYEKSIACKYQIEGALSAASRQFNIYNGVEPTEDE